MILRRTATLRKAGQKVFHAIRSKVVEKPVMADLDNITSIEGGGGIWAEQTPAGIKRGFKKCTLDQDTLTGTWTLVHHTGSPGQVPVRKPSDFTGLSLKTGLRYLRGESTVLREKYGKDYSEPAHDLGLAAAERSLAQREQAAASQPRGTAVGMAPRINS